MQWLVGIAKYVRVYIQKMQKCKAKCVRVVHLGRVRSVDMFTNTSILSLIKTNAIAVKQLIFFVC